ncbi:MAG: S1 RNA-binding domain-containing protein [Planctomycetota bacterium]
MDPERTDHPEPAAIPTPVEPTAAQPESQPAAIPVPAEAVPVATEQAPPPVPSPVQPEPKPEVPAAEAAPEPTLEEQVAAEMAELGGSMDAILEQPKAAEEPAAVVESSEALAEDGEAGDAPVAEPEQAKHFEIKRGRISAIRGEDVFVDLTGETNKLQGVVPLVQFERPPRLGSIMDFVVDKVDEGQGLMFLSREGAISRSTWDQLHRGSVVEARVTKSNKGGLELEMIGGIRAFMPASQIDVHHVDDLESFVGQKIDAKVQEIDHKHKKVLLSRRAHLEEVRRRQKVKLLADLKEGDERQGIVTGIKDFGAFVDLGGLDGLVHITDLSHQHVKKVGDVVKVGDTVTVKVLKIDSAKDRLSLGMKQATPDPWEGINEGAGFATGQEVTGRITRVANFGAFVEVAPGVEALLPISEMSWKRIHKPTEVVEEGQVRTVSVLSIEPGKKRMTVSLKAVQGDPWQDAESKYAKGSEHEGKVTGVTDFGAFVELEQGVEGLVHISELADRRVGKVTDIVNVNDVKTFRVKDIQPGKRKLSLSLRKEDPTRDQPVDTTPRKPRPKIDKSKLRGGMDLGGAGGVGLGGLSLDNLK